MKPTFGVIVGRFQVHELHDGHMELFRHVCGLHDRVLVFLGVAPTGPTKRNPLDFEVRKRMITALFPKVTCLPLKDKKSDTVWSHELDARIADAVQYGEVTLYGSRDSFIPYYNGKYKDHVQTLELSVPKNLRGTDIRAKLTNTIMESPDFRAGIIYVLNNMYDRVIPTVDIAIVHTDPASKVRKVLLGRKPDEQGWRFVGGHAIPKNPNYEADAHMETQEETGLELSNFKYAGSMLVDDWRWRQEDDRIKTMLFVAETHTMEAKGADDIEEVRWFEFEELPKVPFEVEHEELKGMLKKFYT